MLLGLPLGLACLPSSKFLFFLLDRPTGPGWDGNANRAAGELLPGEKVPDTSGFKLTYAWGPDFGAAEGEKLVNQDQKRKRGYRDAITPFYFLSKADAV
jgi:hypothetical protein